MLNKYTVVLKSHAKLTKCYCPRCEKIHKMRIEWKGHGMPRMYCEGCRQTVEGMGPIHLLDSNPSKRKIIARGGAE